MYASKWEILQDFKFVLLVSYINNLFMLKKLKADLFIIASVVKAFEATNLLIFANFAMLETNNYFIILFIIIEVANLFIIANFAIVLGSNNYFINQSIFVKNYFGFHLYYYLFFYLNFLIFQK